MSDEIFKAGVTPGAPQNDFEIIFLICHLIRRAEEPVSFHALADTFQRTGDVNYFEFAALVGEMVDQGHIRTADEASMTYALTEHGEKTAENFYKSIPAAVRERCEKELARQMKRVRRQKENEVSIAQTKDGYAVTLEIPDIGTPLMKLSLFMPTREDCELCKRRFLNDPLYLYKGVLAMATGDTRTVGNLFESREEDLFD